MCSIANRSFECSWNRMKLFTQLVWIAYSICARLCFNAQFLVGTDIHFCLSFRLEKLLELIYLVDLFPVTYQTLLWIGDLFQHFLRKWKPNEQQKPTTKEKTDSNDIHATVTKKRVFLWSFYGNTNGSVYLVFHRICFINGRRLRMHTVEQNTVLWNDVW